MLATRSRNKETNNSKNTSNIVMKNPVISQKSNNRKELNIISSDGIRKLIIPKSSPNKYPACLQHDEYKRIRSQAKVITADDRLKILEEAEKLKQRKSKECAERKAQLEKYDVMKVKGPYITEVEAEAKRRSLHLLKRAFEMRQDQEDELKKANKLILGMKCLAIRDAQVAEKELIKNELEKEERRLDQMMKEEVIRQIKGEDERKDRETQKKILYEEALRDQIKENEMKKFLEVEKIEEECRLMNKVNVQMALDDLERQKKKHVAQIEMRKEMRRVNEELLRIKALEREEARIEELRVQEYMRKKAEREAAREKEEEIQRIAKEQEIARLRALQERQQDIKAQIHEMAALRAQEQTEQEWRKKEREEAKRKLAELSEMKEARVKQIYHRRRMQALEIAREKREFDNVIKTQLEEQLKEEERTKRKQNETEEYRKAILNQINEKEQERIKTRKAVFEEGTMLKAENQRRERYIKEGLKNKIKDLRIQKVPEPYVKEIERQLGVTE